MALINRINNMKSIKTKADALVNEVAEMKVTYDAEEAEVHKLDKSKTYFTMAEDGSANLLWFNEQGQTAFGNAIPLPAEAPDPVPVLEAEIVK